MSCILLSQRGCSNPGNMACAPQRGSTVDPGQLRGLSCSNRPHLSSGIRPPAWHTHAPHPPPPVDINLTSPLMRILLRKTLSLSASVTPLFFSHSLSFPSPNQLYIAHLKPWRCKLKIVMCAGWLHSKKCFQSTEWIFLVCTFPKDDVSGGYNACKFLTSEFTFTFDRVPILRG